VCILLSLELTYVVVRFAVTVALTLVVEVKANSELIVVESYPEYV
jgi:hypothetical protein